MNYMSYITYSILFTADYFAFNDLNYLDRVPRIICANAIEDFTQR